MSREINYTYRDEDAGVELELMLAYSIEPADPSVGIMGPGVDELTATCTHVTLFDRVTGTEQTTFSTHDGTLPKGLDTAFARLFESLYVNDDRLNHGKKSLADDVDDRCIAQYEDDRYPDYD